MTEEELDKFLEPWKKKCGLHFAYYCGQKGNKSYTLVYTDANGVSIEIKPETKHFRFTAIIDTVFTLSSGDMAPIDYKNNFFSKNYDRFTKHVLRYKKNDLKEEEYI